jgi:ketosteroid isomerase-like protein
LTIDEDTVTELEPFFARYAERYMASDVEAIGAMYEAPLLALRDGNVIHLPDREAVRGHLAELMDAYARSGAAVADIVELDVTELGRSSAFATVRWHVRNADGAVIKDFRATYQLVNADGSWRILSYTNHDD